MRKLFRLTEVWGTTSAPGRFGNAAPVLLRTVDGYLGGIVAKHQLVGGQNVTVTSGTFYAEPGTVFANGEIIKWNGRSWVVHAVGETPIPYYSKAEVVCLS